MQTTKVIVIDVEEFDEKGAVFFNAEKVQVLQNCSSVPVRVNVWPLPASELIVSLGTSIQEDFYVDIDPETLTIGP